MLGKTKGYYLITSIPLAENYEFAKEEGYYKKSIEDKEKFINSAYVVRTKAIYKDFIFELFQNENLKKEKKVRLYLNNLDFDAYDYFGFPYRKDDANIVVQEDELEEIWEERTPLSRFPFKVDKVKYIKKEGRYL